VWYAFSSNQGATWDNLELCDDPENDCEGTEEALSYGDFASGPGTFLLRDYMGIDVRDGRVWTAFMGASDEQDPNPHESVIWSTQILLPAP
jgi:hypothetical protein